MTKLLQLYTQLKSAIKTENIYNPSTAN